MNIKEREELFKLHSFEKYGDVIDFSEMNYVNAKTEVVLIHREYGRFSTTPSLHLRRPQWNMKQVRPFGFFNKKENCVETAKEYRNKRDLQQHCYGCYKALQRNGWLEEVSSLLFDNTTHYMKYNDQINCVYAYEFEEEKCFYVGRTNNLKRRDYQHRHEAKRSNKKRQLYTFRHKTIKYYGQY